MKLLLLGGVLVGLGLLGFFWMRPIHAMVPNSLYEAPLSPIDGSKGSWKPYKGKVLLIVNVASKCGYTSQYGGLESLYQAHKDKGLVVMGFPSNDFMFQEPGTDEEIVTFCRTQYDVTFPLFKKSKVRGNPINPIYAFLTSKEKNPEFSGGISWNFNKFLVNRSGKVIARFGSGVSPNDPQLLQAIQTALATK